MTVYCESFDEAPPEQPCSSTDELFDPVPESAPEPSAPKSRKAPPEPSYPYAEMSAFDDLCTEIILDNQALGFVTHKFKEGGIAAPRSADAFGLGFLDLAQNCMFSN